MNKPTHASVTSEPCNCGTLALSASDPTSPIKWDAETNEYHFEYVVPGSRLKGEMVIYHCPFCGGAAPKSQRELLFHPITHAEQQRLLSMTAGLNTVSEVIAKLGAPSRDNPIGIQASNPEIGSSPPTASGRRLLVYENYSDTVKILITDQGDRISVTLVGKYRGKAINSHDA